MGRRDNIVQLYFFFYKKSLFFRKRKKTLSVVIETILFRLIIPDTQNIYLINSEGIIKVSLMEMIMSFNYLFQFGLL